MLRIIVLLAGLPLAGLLLAAPLPAAAAERIVAAGGVVTEILYALGVEDRIVGVDTTSVHPPQALADNPDVGYVRALSAEGVLSLAPDRVIATDAAGPAAALDLVRQAGVPIDVVGEEPTRAGVTGRIRTIGALVGAEARAEALAAEVEADFAALAEARARLDGAQVRVLFVLSLQNGRAMVGGAGTSADAIIALAGGVNAVPEVAGYKPVTDEAIIAAAPDVVLSIARGDHALDPDEVFAMPAFALTPASEGRRLVSMDGLALLGFGPRAPQAAAALMRALHPRAEIPPIGAAEATR
ncbi:heme/hemin ABC transporter substrate-binding protein [Salinarimonas rosea]|uniref:heme/hemin ABC transporter substrate-binding protein n=1 Tax=Salinarimonas rosea TaxID=552063 RepID=UPI0003FDBB0A|nr:ABC transporter substrate-binding protein [Salinarimonas rosea]